MIARAPSRQRADRIEKRGVLPGTIPAKEPPRSPRREGLERGFCPDCWRTWNGLAEAHCSACCLHFRSDAGFDRHRVDGRCLTPGELQRPGKNGKPRLVETRRGWVTALMEHRLSSGQRNGQNSGNDPDFSHQRREAAATERG
jgi:hypothetical protein